MSSQPTLATVGVMIILSAEREAIAGRDESVGLGGAAGCAPYRDCVFRSEASPVPALPSRRVFFLASKGGAWSSSASPRQWF